jgi:hypothetical protein
MWVIRHGWPPVSLDLFPGEPLIKLETEQGALIAAALPNIFAMNTSELN